MKALTAGVFLLLVALTPMKAFADPLGDLYQVSVPVVSQAEKERDKAFSKALSEVVVKISGQMASLEHTGVQQALTEPAGFVQSFSYQKNTEGQAGALSLQVGFDEKAVNRLLLSNDLGVWGANRPDTLLWLAIEEDGVRRIQVNDEFSTLVLEIQSAMKERSLPVIFPLMDLEDASGISVVDVWGLFSESFVRASARYGSDSIIGGRLSYNGSVYDGQIVLIFRGQRADVKIEALTEKQLAQAVVDLVGNTLSSHYAIRSSSKSENLVVEIENINKTKSYAGVANYLQNLAAVKDVMVINVKGDRLVLELVIDGTVNQLSEAIALGRQLRLSGIEEGVDRRLVYRWLGD